MKQREAVQDYGNMPKVYSAWVPHLDVGLDCSVEPSMTRQEFADECDINKLMAQYEKHGVISHFSAREPLYLDLVGLPDLRQTLDLMREADEAFMRLPAIVRKDFDNDAVQFVEFAQDPKNIDKLREWGLAKPLEAPVAPATVELGEKSLSEIKRAGGPRKPAAHADIADE